jgi:hypothetical protein
LYIREKEFIEFLVIAFCDQIPSLSCGVLRNWYAIYDVVNLFVSVNK